MTRKLLLLILLAVPVFASEPKVIPLWPGAAPGSESWNYEEGGASEDRHPARDRRRTAGGTPRPLARPRVGHRPRPHRDSWFLRWRLRRRSRGASPRCG